MVPPGLRLPAVQNVSTLPSWPAAAARAWSRATSPWILPLVVLAGAMAGCLFGIIGEGNAPCDPAHPAVCGPDVGFSLALVLLAGSVLLQWTHPLLACALGVAFAVLDLRYDTPLAGRAFSVFLVLCLGVAAGVSVSRQRQRNLVGTAGGRPTTFSPSGREQHGGRWGWRELLNLFPMDGHALRTLIGYRPTRVIGLLLLVAIGMGAGIAYQHTVSGERAHLARAVRVGARVADGPDDAQTFTPVSTVPGGPGSVQLVPLEWYPEGSIQLIQLDPADPQWARLVAEPDDQTWWLSLAALALLLGAAVAARELSVRQARASLGSGAHPALSARVAQLPDGEVLVLPADRDIVVATLRTRPTRVETSDPSGVPQIRAAVVYGDIRHLGWVAVQTDLGLALPESPLKSMRNPAPFSAVAQDGDHGEEVDLQTLGDEVTVRREAPAGLFPITDEPPWWLRAVGTVMVVGAVVVGPYAAWSWTERFTDIWPVLVLGGMMLGRGVRWLAGGLRITSESATVDSGFFRRELPLAAVEAVRVDRETVILLADDGALSFEPCPEVSPRSVRLERVREVAEALRGLVSESEGGASTPIRRVGVGAVAVTVFVIAVVAAGVARYLL